MHGIAYFEIHGTDTAALAAFYKQLFGWRVERWGESDTYIFHIKEGDAQDGSGINGAIRQRRGPAPAHGAPVMGAVLSVALDPGETLEPYLEKGQQLGATLGVPPFEMPGAGRAAYLRDPDGNVFGLFEGKG